MRRFFITSLFSLIIVSLFSQKAEVRGQISDAINNEPVAFANVIVAGTQIGATTDINGDFIIKGIEPGFIQLQVSYIGYKPTITSDIMLSNNNIPFFTYKIRTGRTGS